MADLGPAVAALLAEPRYRERAAALAAEIAAMAPIEEAAELLAGIADRGRLTPAA